MIIKIFLVLALWFLIGFLINKQFDPTTVVGSVMGSAFIFIWIAILVVGIFSWIKLKKIKSKK
jgi:hypothetical protein|tara:strand:- start:27 stop:215 length:189 start_codon:yes stop_codon:yes gene_type:complete